MTWKDNVLNTKIDAPSSKDYQMDDELPDDFQDDPGPSALKKNQTPIMAILIGAVAIGLIAGFFFLKRQQNAANETIKYTPVSSAEKVMGESDQRGDAAISETEMRLQKIEIALSVMNEIRDQLRQMTDLQKQIDELSTKIGGLEHSMSSRAADMTAQINRLKNSQAKLEALGRAKPAPKKAPAPQPKNITPPVKKSLAPKASPRAFYHTVKPKETLFSISQKYKIDIAQLRKQNNLTGQTTIYIGTKLLITPGR